MKISQEVDHLREIIANYSPALANRVILASSVNISSKLYLF